MKIIVLMFALTVAAPVTAEPITIGAWSTIVTPDNSGRMFMDHTSWDGPHANVAWSHTGWDFLHAHGRPDTPATFFFDAHAAFTDLGGTSDYLSTHVFGRTPDGVLTLDNGHGFTARSDNGAMLLLRLVQPSMVTYRVWTEDLNPLGRSDRDFQDRGFQIRYQTTEPNPVPEPATMLLLGTGLAGLGWRRMRQRKTS